MATVFARTRSGRNPTPESAFRSAGLKWLKIRFHGRIWHLRTLAGPTQRLGVPDDLLCIQGVFVGIEWKRPDGKFSTQTKTYQAQVGEIGAIEAAGGRAGFVASWADLEALVDGLEPVQMGMR